MAENEDIFNKVEDLIDITRYGKDKYSEICNKKYPNRVISSKILENMTIITGTVKLPEDDDLPILAKKELFESMDGVGFIEKNNLELFNAFAEKRFGLYDVMLIFINKKGMTSKKKFVLDSLCEGELSFKEGAEILKTSISEIEKMLDDFGWVPSIDYLKKNYLYLTE